MSSISIAAAEALGNAIAQTPWPPAEGSTMAETAAGHGAVVAVALHRAGYIVTTEQAVTAAVRDTFGETVEAAIDWVRAADAFRTEAQRLGVWDTSDESIWASPVATRLRDAVEALAR